MTNGRRVLTSVILVGLSLSSCGLRPDPHPRALGADAVPRGVQGRPPQASTGTMRILVYFSRDTVLVAVPRAVRSGSDPSTALQSLTAGPSRREQDAGIVSAVSATTFGPQVTVGPDGVAVVDSPGTEKDSSGRTDEVLAFAQVVLTLTSLPDVQAVSFRREGRPLPVPRGDGTLNADPLTRRDYADLL